MCLSLGTVVISSLLENPYLIIGSLGGTGGMGRLGSGPRSGADEVGY